jgi:hypothetical protein
VGQLSAVIARIFGGLARQGAQIPLAVISFVIAIGLLIGAVAAPGSVDVPIAIAIAILLFFDGAARILLWRNRRHLL